MDETTVEQLDRIEARVEELSNKLDEIVEKLLNLDLAGRDWDYDPDQT